MTYLIDTSALVRILRDQADEEWCEAADRGLIAVCEPALAEMLTAVDAGNYASTEHGIRDVYPYVTVPDGVWEQVNPFGESWLRTARTRARASSTW